MAERDPDGLDGPGGIDGLLGTAAADTARWSADTTVPVATLEQTAWRRRRNRLTVTGVVAALVVVTGAVAGTVGRSGSDGDSDTGVSVSVAAEPPRLTRDPAPVEHELAQPAGGVRVEGLPTEGVAIEEGDVVLLVSFQGAVLSRLDGFRISEGLQRGELLLFDATGIAYELDARSGVLAPRPPTADGRTALSYGAELVTINRATGHAQVERDGRSLFEIPGGASVAISWDRDIVTRTGGHGTSDVVAFDLRTDRARSLPDGCRVADRHGPAWFLLCDGSIVRLDPDGDRVVLARGSDVMPWSDALVSPDGRRFLTVSCGLGTPYVGSTSGGGVQSITGPDSPAPLGWSAGGEAVLAGPVVCGRPPEPTAVVAVRDGASRAIWQLGEEENPSVSRKVAMWMPVLERD